MLLFGCSSVLTVVNRRKAKFLDDYLKCYNKLCKLFAYVAENEKKDESQYCSRTENYWRLLILFTFLVKLSVALCSFATVYR